MKPFFTSIYLLLFLLINLSHTKSLHKFHQNSLSPNLHEDLHKDTHSHHLRNSNGIQNQVLLQQSTSPQAKIDQIYIDSLNSLKSLQAEEQKKLADAETSIGQMVTREAASVAQDLSIEAQEVFNKAQSEEDINKELMNRAYQVLTKQVNKIKQEEEEASGNLKDTRVMLLQDRLAVLKEKFDVVNQKFESFQQNLLRMQSKCKDLKDCNTCATNAGCGWCVSESRCIDGTKIGPSYETCSFYSYDICSGSGCSLHKDCTSCIDDAQCGWCAQTVGDNLERCLQKPANYAGCPARQWYHSQGPKDMCDPEPKMVYDLNVAETLEALGYRPDQNILNPDNASIEDVQGEFIQLQAESEALRERLTGIQEELKVIALERFPPEQDEVTEAEVKETEELKAACATLEEPSPENELDGIFEGVTESDT